MTDVGPLPPAGWYVDPRDDGQARYWDGAAWSEHVTPMPPVSPPSSLAPTALPPVAQPPEPSYAAPGALPPVAQPPAPSYAAPAKRRSRSTLWLFTAVIVAGLLVGGTLALLSRSSAQPLSPKAVATRYYQPVFQRLMDDITAVNDASTDSDFVVACTRLHTDLPSGRGLPAVTPRFDALWSTFLSDGSSFAISCLGGPAGQSGGAPAAYDRLTADATDVSTAFDNLPG